MATGANNTPSVPPVSAKRRLSAKNCRPIRPREAPKANRVLISRMRAEPRARKRPATFKQARPNRTAVAANRTQSGSESARRKPEWPCGPESARASKQETAAAAPA